jgi:RNA polymerase sigma-70 factor (ECF subfamily)
MTHLGDEELISKFRSSRGSPQDDPYLNELFGRYSEKVAVWCWRHTGDRELATDLAQEIFLRVFERLDRYEGNARFSTWLYTVARNHCLNALKSRSTRKEDAMEPMVMEPLDEGAPNAEEELLRQGRIGEMQRLLREELNETERRVMVMHYGEELSVDAVTRVLGLENASGAKAFLVSARRKLQRALERGRGEGKGGA